LELPAILPALSSSPQKHLIMDVKALTRILFLYIPLPMFWALLDQQVIVGFESHVFLIFFLIIGKQYLITKSVCPRAHGGLCKLTKWMAIW
jgi:hypothetical protein